MHSPSIQCFDWSHFLEFPAIGILRGFATPSAVAIAEQCFDAGLRYLEVTLNTPEAPEQIRRIRAVAPENARVGAGTVLDEAGAVAATQAGASYLVTPVVNAPLIHECRKRGIPVFPGAYTPTEVWTAWQAGATAVKLFPCDLGGPPYLRSLRAPLEQIPLIAVGGVNRNNIGEYLDAGAIGVGLGSPLFHPERMRNREWGWLREQIAAFREVFEKRRP
jgi:2-dehydro-3-deoxyphosphogluconate aldolase / (4S)-4-hydroxy-2-oxoglutarate aldolase